VSGFVSLPPAADSDPPQPAAADVVTGDGWWPDVNLTDLRQAVRLDTTIGPERLRDAVRAAMLDVNRQLAAWRAGPIPASASSLTALPADLFDGQSRYVLHYTRALYSTVAADLGERLLSQTLTGAGADRADELRAEVAEHRRNARWAVNDLTGAPRATIEAL